MRKAVSLFAVSLFVINSLFAQFYRPENRTWRMGSYGGVDFTDSGLLFKLSSMWGSNNEACASIADAYGNLLFYSNGWKAWSANDSVMPHANPVNGPQSVVSPTISQGALIVPTHRKDAYYLFTLMQDGYNNKLYCYVINMNLNNGLGDIDTTAPLYHIPIYDSFSERMIAIPGCRDNIWVLVHHIKKPIFYAFQIDANDSIHTTPVISNYGGSDFGNVYFTGQLKVSPQWDKVAIGAPHLATLHFDIATGQLSDYQVIDSGNSVYTMEFSPNGQMLYAAVGSLSQYDLNFPQTGYNKVSISPMNPLTFSLKLGPDSCIYTNYFTSRINHPDSPGTACGFDVIDNIIPEYPVYPPDATGGIGLPNLVVFPGNPEEPDTFNLVYDTTYCVMPDIPVTLTASPEYSQRVWNTGDTSMSIAVQYPGFYWATYMDGCITRVDTYRIKTILPALSISYANGMLSTTHVFTTYQWYKDGDSIAGGITQSVNATGDGVYKVVVSNGNGCTDSAEYVLEGSGVGSVNVANDIAIYPNPAKDKMWVKCPVHCTVTITSIDGKLYYEGQDSSAPVDISDYGNGMYYIVLRDHNKTLLAVRKLVVMR